MLRTYDKPPQSRASYIISQFEGERMTIPGSKGAFRILASSKQTDGKISVFQSGSVLADAPGFHFHKEAHDVFLVTKGFLKLWNGDKCRILGPGDFAYVPPNIIHNPEILGPHTETFGLVAPGEWIDFFRYVCESFEGVLAPEDDNRDLKAHIIPKVMAAPKDYDVHFVRDYDAPGVSDWDETDQHGTKLPGELEPYYLQADKGPRWMAGGVMSRPFITTEQSGGRFAISSIESSNAYGQSWLTKSYYTFSDVDHCLCLQEGSLRINLKGDDDATWSTVHAGETVMIAAGQGFKLDFTSKFVRIWSFTNGKGLEYVIQAAGEICNATILPNVAKGVDDAKIANVCKDLQTQIG